MNKLFFDDTSLKISQLRKASYTLRDIIRRMEKGRDIRKATGYPHMGLCSLVLLLRSDLELISHDINNIFELISPTNDEVNLMKLGSYWAESNDRDDLRLYILCLFDIMINEEIAYHKNLLYESKQKNITG